MIAELLHWLISPTDTETAPEVVYYPGDVIQVVRRTWNRDYVAEVVIESVGPSPFYGDDRVLAYVTALDEADWFADYVAYEDVIA